MADPLSITAAKGPIVPVPLANQQAQAHAAKTQADTIGTRNSQPNGAGGSKKTQDQAPAPILGGAPMGASQSKQNKTDGPRPTEDQLPGNGRSERSTAEAAKTLKDYLGSLPSELSFDYDEETGRQIFRVVNPVTREVVKQFPPDELLEMAKRLKELSKNADDNGMLFDDRF